jgi:long-chain acyl-CoA synthetase
MRFAAVDAELTAPGRAFEIVDRRIDGHPVRAWQRTPENLAELFRQSRRHGARPFLIHDERVLDYAGHYEKVASCARLLRERFGVRPGDRVAIAMRNLPEFSVVYWATLAIGAIVVPLNSWGTPAELAAALTDCGAALVFADPERASRIAAADTRPQIVSVGGTEPGALDFAPLLREFEATELESVRIGPDDPATIFYTSGTSGHPKGVLGTHFSVCSRVPTAEFLRARAGLGPLERPVFLLGVPMFHVTGCHAVLLTALTSGGCVVLMHRWDPARAAELVDRFEVTHFTGVPVMVSQLVDEFDRRGGGASLRSLASGGSPTPAKLRGRVEKVLPAAGFASGYGLTECAGMVAMIGAADLAERPDSVGVPPPTFEIEIVDPERRVLPPGKPGEVRVRTPTGAAGYWEDPSATAAAFADGWFHTGDEGLLDDDGFLHIVGRLKDIVLRGGENISCAEVEGTLGAHPAVADVAVFGVPDPVLGEAVAAVVAVAPDAAVSVEELREFAAGRLASYKVPARIGIRRDPLPIGATGKTLKKDLRVELLAQTDGTTTKER